MLACWLEASSKGAQNLYCYSFLAFFTAPHIFRPEACRKSHYHVTLKLSCFVCTDGKGAEDPGQP